MASGIISSSIEKVQKLEHWIASMTGSMDETYEEIYVPPPPVLGANISVVGTAANNSSNRELIIDGDTIYSDNGGSGSLTRFFLLPGKDLD